MNDIFSQDITSNFTSNLRADSSLVNEPRQVYNSFYSYVYTKTPFNPELIHHAEEFIKELGVEIQDIDYFTQVMSGAKPIEGFKSFSMCYGGHQFGSWAGQLGDGRAINIAEFDINNKNWSFQLKGAGPTPYSRTADGLAVLRSSVREYLCSEAMHYLGVPTTRALSLVKTGDAVTRDVLYDGHPEDEDGAIVCRVAPSFIRFGNFEIFSIRKDYDNLKKLLDYTITQHYSHLGVPSKETYIEFFREVVVKTKEMIIHWQRVGFVHGVMNTDNMSILGLTIDYGPYGWLEDYDPSWTPNTTDSYQKRYRYESQGNVGLWNLIQLAKSIYPLIEDAAPLQKILNDYEKEYASDYHKMICSKLGLYRVEDVSENFIKELKMNLVNSEIDMTIFFRELCSISSDDFDKFYEGVLKSSYKDEDDKSSWQKFYTKYSELITNENDNKREEKMKLVNPKYVLRNYMAHLATQDLKKGNSNTLNELYTLLLNPYDEQPELEKWYEKRPAWAKTKVGCSMLSCSS
ncbi:MAG: Selenoprotein O and cysteine-containing homologs [uncultured Campylobacterales bacterium]|uniref:Protein nucleotidyltransferase YdiU n=1 Tax=uncultured Campylobacterales bacterium TaxID=352960 RepID=A0A6S6TDI8_9BACT|nr:MAG: Selenoprotein O and cysteine-containing homologs [uncultured Campylobacterales bacterium]